MTLNDFMKGLQGEVESIEVLKKHCSFNIEKYVNNPNALDGLSAEKYNEIRNELIDIGFKVIEEKTVPKMVFGNNKEEKDSNPHYYYNYEFKMKYLDEYTDYTEDTKRVVRSYFRSVAESEELFGKDVKDFNSSEIEKMLKSLKLTTVRSLHNIVNYLIQYIDYCVKKGYATGANLFHDYTSQDVLKNYIADEKIHFERKEIMDIAMGARNAQDGAIIALLFEGLSHKDNFKEITELKVSDVDLDNNTVYVSSRNEKIKISQETAILLKNAINHKTYYSIKGDTMRTYELESTSYVFRSLRYVGDKPLSFRVINQRILRIAKENGYSKLNATNVSLSGQVYMAHKLYMENPEMFDKSIVYTLQYFGFAVNKSSLFSLKKRIKKFTGVHIPAM